jgi:hypothetical protein
MNLSLKESRSGASSRRPGLPSSSISSVKDSSLLACASTKKILLGFFALTNTYDTHAKILFGEGNSRVRPERSPAI